MKEGRAEVIAEPVIHGKSQEHRFVSDHALQVREDLSLHLHVLDHGLYY